MRVKGHADSVRRHLFANMVKTVWLLLSPHFPAGALRGSRETSAREGPWGVERRRRRKQSYSNTYIALLVVRRLEGPPSQRSLVLF